MLHLRVSRSHDHQAIVDGSKNGQPEHNGKKGENIRGSKFLFVQFRRKKTLHDSWLLRFTTQERIPIYRDDVEMPFDIAVKPSTTAQHVVFKMVEKTRSKLQMTLCLVEVIESLHIGKSDSRKVLRHVAII